MAEIITPERATRSAGPGLSYWLGSKIMNQPLAMETSLATRLQGAIKDKLFDTQVSVGIGGPLGSRFVGQKAGQSGYRVTDDGIAILSVAGVLIDRGEWLGDMAGWATTYEGMSEQIRRILKDDAIKAVVLDVDSGGGMAAGLFDLCEQLAKLRGKRKLYAVAANFAASAAYAIACTADELFVTRTGSAGSIGVISMHMSYADMLAQIGVEPTIIHAGAHKANGNPYQALSHNARAEMSAQCDQLMATFVAHVARERDLAEDAVIDMQARVYTGDKAVAANLCDGVKSFEEVLEHVRASAAKGGRPRGKSTSTTSTGDRPAMTGNANAGERPDLEAMLSAFTAGVRASQQAAPPAAAPAAAPIVAAPAVTVTGTAAVSSAEAERTRIGAILGSDAAKTRGKLANHLAFNTTMGAAEAIALLDMSGAETAAAASQTAVLGSALETEMAKRANSGGIRPDAAVGAGGDTDPKATASQAAVAGMIGFMDAITSRARPKQ